ncbi:MAG: hypothetical protein CVV33_03675 [Methanomicrobiales archaeon HGW-Methanomicrobiales-4]|nr:MAG: hypothetical protein CVV33_03675 [Methanomicrobiales archaeon HGW-Methanomicrobiales-4]
MDSSLNPASGSVLLIKFFRYFNISREKIKKNLNRELKIESEKPDEMIFIFRKFPNQTRT